MNTRRFARSMTQAFGPYTSNNLQPMPTKPAAWRMRLKRVLLKLQGRWLVR